MKAVVIDDGELQLLDRATPDPVLDEVLVEVAGAGVNRADLLQRVGAYPAPPGWPADIPGLEFSGTVAGAGPLAQDIVGKKVMGIVGGGAQATHLITRGDLCVPVPDGIDLVEAGGIPEVFITAHDALVQARVRPGDRVLVQGVGSGVGTAAIQLAKAMGATTIGTSRTAGKLDRAAELGLDEPVLAGPKAVEQIGAADVVLELIGGDYLNTDLEVCSPRARIVIIGLIAGAEAKADLSTILRKRLTIIGTQLRNRPHHEKAATTARFAREVIPLFERGLVQPVVDRIVALDDVADAYDAIESNAPFGKVILKTG
ncbi:MAG: NAD(P)H-quinone oxidoreductase [Actinomycetota bacterium]